MASKSGTLILVAAALLWVGWCFLVVTTIMPAVLRKLTIYPGTSAYVLCIAPAILIAVLVISRVSGEES